MSERPSYPDTTTESAAPSRRGLLFGMLSTTSLAALSLLPKDLEAATGRIRHPRVTPMEGHNMPAGYTRSRIDAEVGGEPQLIGSIFFLEDDSAKAQFINKQLHPEEFHADGRPDFGRISGMVDTPVMIAAGAFFDPAGNTEGIALENGRMVGSDQVVQKLRGLLVIKDGIPSIANLAEIPDFDDFLMKARKNGWSLFQQMSYIRGKSTLSSSNPKLYELRFFVEGEGKKAIINFTEKMTYAEAIAAMKEMAGFKIERAIGLDGGTVSEGRFYDRTGEDFVMVDEQYGAGRGYTNVVMFYSDGQQ